MYGTGIPSPYQLLGQGVTALGQGIGSLYNQVTQGQEPRGNQPPRRSLREAYGLPTQTKMVDGIPIDVQRGVVQQERDASLNPQQGAGLDMDYISRMSKQESAQQERTIPSQEELAERDYQNRAVNMAQQKDPYMVGAAALNSTDPAIAMQINKALYGMNYAVPSTPNPMLAGMMPPPGPRDNEQSMAQKMQIGIGNPDAARMGNIPFGMQEGSLMDKEAANEFLAKYKFFEPR